MWGARREGWLAVQQGGWELEGRPEAEALGKQFLRQSLGGRTFRKSCCPRKLASYMPEKPPVRLPFLMVGPIWFGRESMSGLGPTPHPAGDRPGSLDWACAGHQQPCWVYGH